MQWFISPLLPSYVLISLVIILSSSHGLAVSSSVDNLPRDISGDKHYIHHMEFRQFETERRIEAWHKALQQRGHERRMLFREGLQLGNAGRVSATDPSDKEVLLDLYESTAGHGWAKNTGWSNKSSDPCSLPWTGVYCQGNRVVSIELVYNNMAGPLPQSLGKLSALQQLVFYSNMITGEIPSSIFALPSLTALDLNNNQLTGSLPSSITAHELQNLVLYSNQLTGHLPTAWNTPHLETLEISTNAFTGPPPEKLSIATGLKELVISRNNLTGEFPDAWGDLSNLTKLWTFNNEIKAPLPSSWEHMKSLENVEMDGVMGALPEWIGNWRNITLLILARGQISGSLPQGICHLSRVQTLWLFQNSLTGTIPSCIGEWTSIQQLELSDNQLSGDIPTEIGRLQQLEYLYLSRNAFNTTLPSGLGELKSLQIMDISSNQIVGDIPVSFNALAGTMANFALCYNKLSGPITEKLEPLFKAIGQFSCALYNVPWQCPIPSFVPSTCDCQCDKCNTVSHRDTCTACLADSECGFCQESPSQLSSCLEGSSSGPSGDGYECMKWNYGSASNCTGI